MKTFKELREDLNDSDELDEGIVSKTLTGLVDKGLNKVLDKLEKMTGKHLGFVQKSTVPSAGKDAANDSLRGDQFKKEAEDFHRKAKKQWTLAKKELGKGFKFYGNGDKAQTPKYGGPAMRQIPADQKEFVKRLEAEMQEIIDMHTQLEKMMQTTGNSVKYQRTMEKLESDTNRVFKEIHDGDKPATYTSKSWALQGKANLAKAKKMTHKEPNQRSPAKFRKYGNMGEENTKTFKELREDLNDSDELDEGIVTNLVDKGLNKVLDKIEKMTGKHLGLVQKSNIPSAGKDKANTALHWSADAYVTGKKLKKEAEDFHRKAKKQWTWSKKEVGDSFKYYVDAGVKIPPEQREMVSDLQAEMQKIIDMHTQLEKMMQTTGNSVKYQRTMEKLESDTNRVFKEIAKVTERGDAKYRAMQGMDNLAKAKKMTHKTPNQRRPVQFRAYANKG